MRFSMLRPLAALALVLAAFTTTAAPARAQYEQESAFVQVFTVPDYSSVLQPPYYLASVGALGLYAPNGGVVGIYAWNGSNLVGPDLARVAVTQPVTSGLNLVMHLPVSVGQTYAAAFFGFGVTLDPGLRYGGQAFSCSAANGCTAQTLNGGPASLYGFTVGIGNASTTAPEPSTFALAAAGLAFAGLAARRRRA